MPYRRLPNTDNARIKALRTAIQKLRSNGGKDIKSVDYITLETLLRNFENVQGLYKSSLETQSSSNRKFQKLVKNTRLYISHFIQVLNLCVIRGEVKPEAKQLYNIEPDNYAVPDLISNEAIIKWGDLVIKGEQARVSQGGTPIYNPTIARVNVTYSQFKDAFFVQKTHQNTTARHLKNMSCQREGIDSALYKLWNEVEALYMGLPDSERYDKCREYGIVYYLRKNEKINANN